MAARRAASGAEFDDEGSRGGKMSEARCRLRRAAVSACVVKNYDMLSSVLSPCTKGLYGDGRRSGQERRTNKGTTCELRPGRAGRVDSP